MAAQNYARHIPSGRLEFFDQVPPREVFRAPEEWAMWSPTNLDLAHRIGEGPHEYCKRNGHRPRVCRDCRVRPSG